MNGARRVSRLYATRKIITLAVVAIGVEMVLCYQIRKPEKTMAEVFHDLCVESTGNAGCDQTNTGALWHL